MESSFAPELEGGLAWLNTEQPLKMSGLRGQVVILDFWTYCCVNCMHVLPILHELEQRRANDPIVVIGIHSGKFSEERDPDRIREAMARYGITHPVYVDRDMLIWEKYGVSSWPTLVIVKPNGRIAAIAPGEPDAAVLDGFIDKIIAEARADGSLAKGPVLMPASAPVVDGPLAYPGKILGGPGERMFIADSGHHRVLVLNRNGAVLDTIGSGLQGLREGSFAQAAFDDPQGLALEGDSLYIADARAHAILRADLKTRRVERIAGTGKLGLEFLGEPKPAKETPLRSPWSVALDGRRLLFASAGTHQIGVLDLDAGTVARFSGSGRESINDGPANKATYAQPSELWIDNGSMYVADSETSAIRMVDVQSGTCVTLVGEGLFDFGDVDGHVDKARLQHPLGVAMTAAGLVVADTYNNKLRLFSNDLQSLSSVPMSVGGKPLHEPGGLGVESDGSLLVADTNNHRLVRLPVRDGELVADAAQEIRVNGAPKPSRGLALPETAEAAKPPPGASEGFFSVVLQPQSLGGGERAISLVLQAPDGYEMTEGAPYDVVLEVSRRSDLVQLPSEHLHGTIGGGRELCVPIAAHVDAAAPAVDSEIVVRLRVVVCDVKDFSACFPLENRLRLPLKLGAGGGDVSFEALLTPPR